MKINFILIDDVAMNNMICRMIIKNKYPSSNITEFLNAQDAIDFLKNQFDTTDASSHTFLFLDIYMPVMDGWGFMDEYTNLNNSIKNKITVNFLSSTLTFSEIEIRAKNYKDVSGFKEKPLNGKTLDELVNSIQQID